MSSISILKRLISTARAGLVFVGMLSPMHAAYRHDAVSVFPDMPKKVAADHSSAVLTAPLPWLAPVGHRHQADVPQSEAIEWVNAIRTAPISRLLNEEASDRAPIAAS